MFDPVESKVWQSKPIYAQTDRNLRIAELQDHNRSRDPNAHWGALDARLHVAAVFARVVRDELGNEWYAINCNNCY